MSEIERFENLIYMDSIETTGSFPMLSIDGPEFSYDPSQFTSYIADVTDLGLLDDIPPQQCLEPEKMDDSGEDAALTGRVEMAFSEGRVARQVMEECGVYEVKLGQDGKGLEFSKRSKGKQPVKSSDRAFTTATTSDKCVIHADRLNLVPASLWRAVGPVSFGFMVETHFQRRNHAPSRFILKLFNALRITDDNPALYQFMGVKWVNDVVICLNKFAFGQLLGISQPSTDGALLNAQGNFTTHGFVEVTRCDHLAQLNVNEDLVAVHRQDDNNCKFLVHAKGLLTRLVTGSDMESYKGGWQKETCTIRDVCTTYGLHFE